MNPPPGHRSERPEGGTTGERRLQRRGAPELTIVGRQDLRPFEHRQEAEHLARLEADRELIEALQWAGFEGEGWRELALALAEYGLAVMAAWLSTGVIVRKCKEKNLRGVQGLSDRALAPDAVDELATLVVGSALESFRETVLKTHKWDPRRGASLKTYFVGHCCIRFVSIYRQWRAEEGVAERLRPLEREHSFDRATGVHRDPAPEPDRALIHKEDFDALAHTITDPVTRNILTLKAQLYTDAEIAEVLELTVPTVKSRIHALRRSLRKVSGDDT